MVVMMGVMGGEAEAWLCRFRGAQYDTKVTRLREVIWDWMSRIKTANGEW
jgi:hypothetical protein